MWQECQWDAQQMAASLSSSLGEPEASCLSIPSYVEMHLRWGVTGVHEDTLHLMTGQKKLEDKSDMARMMAAIEEYL